MWKTCWIKPLKSSMPVYIWCAVECLYSMVQEPVLDLALRPPGFSPGVGKGLSSSPARRTNKVRDLLNSSCVRFSCFCPSKAQRRSSRTWLQRKVLSGRAVPCCLLFVEIVFCCYYKAIGCDFCYGVLLCSAGRVWGGTNEAWALEVGDLVILG